MKLANVLLFVMFTTLCQNVSARAYRKSCGKYLANRISELCKARGGYPQLTVTTTADERNPRRTKRGIVEECCNVSCTDAALAEYCMDSGSIEDPSDSNFKQHESRLTTRSSPVSTVVKRSQVLQDRPRPIEFGTVRPEFNNINTKYIIHRWSARHR